MALMLNFTKYLKNNANIYQTLPKNGKEGNISIFIL
jgi:hypothetical protein